METNDEIARFKKSRNEAFLSLDEKKLRDHQRQWNNLDMPADMEIFWGSVHKAITGCNDLPLEFRKKSKAWLTERGLESHDDGNL